jgi:hypothetical protein
MFVQSVGSQLKDNHSKQSGVHFYRFVKLSTHEINRGGYFIDFMQVMRFLQN